MSPRNATVPGVSHFVAGYELDDANASPAPTPHEFTIGTSNPALDELKQRRWRLNSRQRQLVRHLDKFYANLETPKKNTVLGLRPPIGGTLSELQSQQVTLSRRASFLLNLETMNSLQHLVDEVEARPDLHGSVKLEVNAFLHSAKKHTEHVMAAALQDAMDGKRICPLVFQPLRFSQFLDANRFQIRNILSACCLQQPARDDALKPAMENLAESYFAHSWDYEGAPMARPDKVVVALNSPYNFEVFYDPPETMTMSISMESAGAEQFCRALRVDASPSEDGLERSYAYLLNGFENLSMEKKLAGFYLRSLFIQLARSQELVGLNNVDFSQHGRVNRQIAARTLAEFHYKGSWGFGDLIDSADEFCSQRECGAFLVSDLRELDKKCVEETGTPLITMPEMRRWLNSTAIYFDLQALREPAIRLMVQAPPLTGLALLNLPEFKN